VVTSHCQPIEARAQFLCHFTVVYTLSLSRFLFTRFEEMTQHLGWPGIILKLQLRNSSAAEIERFDWELGNASLVLFGTDLNRKIAMFRTATLDSH